MVDYTETIESGGMIDEKIQRVEGIARVGRII